MDEPSEYDYFSNKRTDRVYLSRSISNRTIKKDDLTGKIQEIERPIRIVSKVIDSEEDHEFIKDGKQISLRITPGGRQEIVAKFYEDNRGIFVLQVQKYTKDSGVPHKTSFSFVGKEIATLFNFIQNVALLPIESSEGDKLDDSFVNELVLDREQLLKLIENHQDIFKEIIQNEVSKEEIGNLIYRKEQLEIFERLLFENEYFEEKKQLLGKNKRDEDVWQSFFERNTWIFGYGLNFIFNSALSGKKLEQVVKGHSVFGAGKRVDGLLKTRGLISSLCFAEIKTHRSELLKKVKTPYRTESWSVSNELSGGISQIQKTVQKSIESIKTKTQLKNEQGDLTGEELFLYQPKSYLIIGSHNEFHGEHGINEDKYSSFELFRKNIFNPEIITFDELLERAKQIVKSEEK